MSGTLGMSGRDERDADRAAAQQGVAEVFHNALRPAMAVMVCSLVVMAGCYMVRFAGRPWHGATLAALAAAGVILLMRRGIKGRALTPAWAHAVALGCVGVFLGVLMTAMVTASGRMETSFVTLLLVGCGLLFLSWAWWAASVALIGGAWLSVVLGWPVMVLWDLHPYILIGGVMLSAFALAVRRASVRHMVGSQLREAHNNRELQRLAAALGQSEARIRTIVEQQTEMVCRYQPDTTLTFVNASYARAFGREAAELVGLPFLMLVPESERERIKAYLAGFTPEDNLRQNEYRVHVSRGQTRVQMWTDQAFFDEKGKLAEFQSVGRDVTRQRAAELALRDSEARYRLLAENAQDLITGHAVDGRYLYVSPSSRTMVGYEPEELIGVDPYTLFHPEDQARIRGSHDQIVRSPQAVRITYRYRHKLGHWVWLESLSRQVLPADGDGDGDGEPRGQATLMAVTRDVSQRVERERELRETRDLLERIITGSPVAVIALDRQARVTLWNDAAEQIFGWKCEEVLGRLMPIVPESDLEDFRARVRQELAGRHAHTGPGAPAREARRLRKDGTLIDVAVNTGPIRGGDGKIVGTLGVFTDITQRKQAQLALQQSEEHHRRAAQSNRRLLAEVNHRVRNNLASLRSLLRMVGQRATDVRQFAISMEARLDAMIQVHALLSEASWQDVELRRLLEGLSRFTHDLTPHDNVVTLDGPAVMLDPRQSLSLSMALAELHTNAVKYGCLSVPGGRLRITWQVHESGEGQRRPRLELRWCERGGPRITQPPRASLGAELVEGFIRFELGGECELRYPPDGVEHRLAFDLQAAGASAEAVEERSP